METICAEPDGVRWVKVCGGLDVDVDVEAED